MSTIAVQQGLLYTLENRRCDVRVLVTGATGDISGRRVASLCNADWVEAVVGADIRMKIYQS